MAVEKTYLEIGGGYQAKQSCATPLIGKIYFK